MKLDRSQESTLLVALAEALANARLKSWGYLQLEGEWENSFRSSIDEDFQKRIYSKLDDGGFTSLIQRLVLERFYDLNLNLPERDADNPDGILLSSYQGFSDVLEEAKRITKIVAGLPNQYAVCALAFKSKVFNFDQDFSVKINDQLIIESGYCAEKKINLKIKNRKLDELFRSHASQKNIELGYDPEKLYFYFRSSGLISDRSRTRIVQSFLDDIRAFYGIGLAMNVLSYHPFFRDDRQVVVTANLISDEGFEFCHSDTIDGDVRDASSAWFRVQQSNIAGARESIELIAKVMASPDSQRLKTAAMWILRAHLAERGMDKILDSSIAMEVLLGDREASDRIGLSKLMANRCAFALGKSVDERKEISDTFIKFYKIRSDIVHSGRLNLSKEEGKVVDQGLELAQRVFRHESGLS